MRRQLAAAFVIGVLCSAIGLTVITGVIPGQEDRAEAQETNTWQMVYLGDYPAEDFPEAFITQVPATCDIMPNPHDAWVYFYRCPETWEPVNPYDA